MNDRYDRVLFYQRSGNAIADRSGSVVARIFGAALRRRARFHFRRLVPAKREEQKMNSRNRIFILLAVICAASLAYYFLSTPSSKDLVLIGTVEIGRASCR